MMLMMLGIVATASLLVLTTASTMLALTPTLAGFALTYLLK